MQEIDKWALLKLSQLNQKVIDSYNKFEFHLITHALHHFCTTTMSSLYLDMTKDRLYCDKKDGLLRRSTQTALYQIVDNLIKLIAPILVFSSEDAYSYFNNPNKKQSVHLEGLPVVNKVYLDNNLEIKWQNLLEIKNLVYQKLEKLRNEKIVKSFLEAEVNLTLKEKIDFDGWESLLIVGKVNLNQGIELVVEVKPAQGEKCERCWKVLSVKAGLCERCTMAIYS